MKLLQRLDRACRLAHFARSTREQYARWVEQFLRFHRAADGAWRTPGQLRGPDVGAFLTHMAVERRLSESSQNQALCALVFLYERVLVGELTNPPGAATGACADDSQQASALARSRCATAPSDSTALRIRVTVST